MKVVSSPIQQNDDLSTQNYPFIEVNLSSEMVLRIISYIGDKKTLRNFSMVSKYYYDGGGIPEECVVRTCLMSGGKAKKTMEKLYPLIKRRSIHPPSSRRLLTLATGLLCEYCKNAFRYDKNNSVKIVRDPYALHLCWRCATKRQRTKRLAKKGLSFRYDVFAYHSVLDHKRTSCKKIGKRGIMIQNDDVERQINFSLQNDHDSICHLIFH